jgi:hypothetical protein
MFKESFTSPEMLGKPMLAPLTKKILRRNLDQ